LRKVIGQYQAQREVSRTMFKKMMEKWVTGAVVCALSFASSSDANAGWGSSGGSWGSSGGSWGSSGGSWGSSGGSWGSSGGSWGSSGGSWGSSGGSVGRWHGRRHTSVYSAGSWGSSGGSWGSSGGSWGSSGGSVGVVSGADVSPYVVRPQAVVVARATNSVSRPDARSALLTVSVPADARVYVNGKATSSTGSFRQFTSPSLSQGAAYTYEVRAEATRGGQVVGQTQTVQLRAGQTQNLAFNLDQPRAVETSLTLQVPQDAIVVLAGEATTATGSVRTYKTKTLTPGQAWSDYSIQVSVVRNGQLVTQEKTIRLVGGHQESLRFSFDDQQVAAR
jgi:uncharacterized protein (TIGR03000 family)